MKILDRNAKLALIGQLGTPKTQCHRDGSSHSTVQLGAVQVFFVQKSAPIDLEKKIDISPSRENCVFYVIPQVK